MSHSSCHLAFIGEDAAQSLTPSRSYYACWPQHSYWHFLAYLDYLIPGGFADAIDSNATVNLPGRQRGDRAFRNY